MGLRDWEPLKVYNPFPEYRNLPFAAQSRTLTVGARTLGDMLKSKWVEAGKAKPDTSCLFNLQSFSTMLSRIFSEDSHNEHRDVRKHMALNPQSRTPPQNPRPEMGSGESRCQKQPISLPVTPINFLWVDGLCRLDTV